MSHPFPRGAGAGGRRAGQLLRSPRSRTESASLYEHCALALDASLAVAQHGLPLIGGGDWNDGMNRVGEGGKGESVWLAGSAYDADRLCAAGRYARRRDRARRHGATHAAALQEALEQEAWDGDWYRRAWFDDGTPLGSATNDECRIDSIAQSWAVISGAARPSAQRGDGGGRSAN